MWLAARQRTTIISADSRQIYRGFDIGTAKPSPAEQAAVVHRGIDVAAPTERYSAAAWSSAASEWLVEAVETSAPLVVGGTGLYLRALFEGLFDEPALEPARRGQLAATLGALDLSELRRWTSALDPARAHLGRTQLLRSIEIALLTGHRLSDLQRERARVSRWRPRYLLVDPGPVLIARITARIDHMLEHGWLDEVQQLMRTVPANAPAWNATGYAALRRVALGESSLGAARDTILIETRQYAKRQRTWFRHQLPAERVTVVDPLAPDWERTVAQWSAGSFALEPRPT
jgi:tRNA dimethylallyltransferase